jgi:hypothetical protein
VRRAALAVEALDLLGDLLEVVGDRADGLLDLRGPQPQLPVGGARSASRACAASLATCSVAPRSTSPEIACISWRNASRLPVTSATFSCVARSRSASRRS